MVATTRDRLAARVEWFRVRRLERRAVWQEAGRDRAAFSRIMAARRR